MAANDSGTDLAQTFKREIQQAPKHINPFATLVRNLCTVRERTVLELARSQSAEIRIALVSMPELAFKPKRVWSLKRKRAPAGVDPEAWWRQLAAFGDEASASMLAAFKGALATALGELRANVVCVSELGFPSHDLAPLADAKRLAYDMSHDHKALIIAGSTHDERTCSNTGYMFHPRCPEDGVTFHKAVSATAYDERISAPAPRQVPAVEIFGLGIASMICLDIADYATLASVVRVADRIDMILVPCYTKRFEKMLDIAKMASRALPGLVALVNANLTEPTAARYHVARFGHLEELKEVRHLESGAVISLIEIDYEEFKKTRMIMKTTPEYDMEWLFGSRDLPEVYT